MARREGALGWWEVFEPSHEPGSRVRLAERSARSARSRSRRVEVYFCPHCHEPCESARDVREHLADCAPVPEPVQ
jgi:hypothetical protein